MERLEDYRLVCPILAPLFIEEGDDGKWRICINYESSIDPYRESEKVYYGGMEFFDKQEAVDFLENTVDVEWEMDCYYRPIQKIGENYFYLHNRMAQLNYDGNECFVNFENGVDDYFLLSDRDFYSLEELLEFVKNDKMCFKKD